MTRGLFGLMLLALVWHQSASAATIPATVRICGDAAEWRPYTYFTHIEGSTTAVATGYSVEFLRRLLEKAGHRATIELLPWKRCLAAGKAGEYDIVLDVVDSPQRRRDYLFPHSHYQVTAAYLYSTARAKPVLQRLEDLRSYQICQQAGYAYDRLLPPDLKVSVSADSKTLESAVKMLEQSRCDLLLSNLEVVNSYLAQGLLPALKTGAVRMEPLALPEPIHYRLYPGVSPAVPYHAELIALLNKGITEMQQSGEADRLMAQSFMR